MPPKSHITYHKFHQLVAELCDQVKHLEIDYIVAPSRGGLLPGVIMSHILKKRLVPVQWSTRDHEEREHILWIEEDLNEGKNVLFVDDINDTGQTIIELIEDWNYNSGTKGKLTVVSVFQRYSTKRPSDYYRVLIEDDSWVVFPWETE